MATEEPKNRKTASKVLAAFDYSYVVLAILMLLTAGSTLAFYKVTASLDTEAGRVWTPVVALIGFCVSLLVFGATYREIQARKVLQKKTTDLINAQKQNNKLLAAEQASRAAAEQANLAKDEFLAVVSHELRTPLNAIAGWNRILRTDGISDITKRTAVEKIDTNLRHQTRIVEELLSFSDIMSSGMNVDASLLKAHGVIAEAVAYVSVPAFQKGITVVEKDTLDSECVNGDRQKLKLALTKVLTNAVKYTPEGGNVDVTAFCDEENVMFVVKDTGVGIEPDAMTHIFDQYRQSEDATTRRYGGLGLGLTIAEHIVKLHKGTIRAESGGSGTGSKFTITIPRADNKIVH